MKVLMVCLGNICRSPLAEGILMDKVRQHGLNWEVESAGTGSWHIGQPPDKRSVQIARQNNIDISRQRARQFSRSDFEQYDLILTMDSQNYRDVLAQNHDMDVSDKVKMILNYSFPGQNLNVPDPYFEGGFGEVFTLLNDACDKIIEKHISGKSVK